MPNIEIDESEIPLKTSIIRNGKGVILYLQSDVSKRVRVCIALSLELPFRLTKEQQKQIDETELKKIKGTVEYSLW